MIVWDQVKEEVTKPHIAYATTGFALILFGTISLFLKERLYIGEATVATIYGLIVGPHCLDWFSPTTWGNTDYITLEISRIVLVVQIFAVAVELPKRYMLKHWWSVTMLLLPVMAFGWVVSSVFIWKLVPPLRWIEALCIAGCVTATDPVLAAAVVGKGKFSRRVPGHLRNLLSAESACNDGMAYPFVIMAVYIIKDEHHPAEIAKDFICIGVLYSCILGVIIGAVIGYGARHLIKFAERFNLIDRESFLVYYFCVAIFCSGVGTLCGVDDLLVAFAAGAAFSWDGWFSKKTEESHVSDVIDVLLNTAFFVYFGAIVPWPDFNNIDLGIRAWKLVCLAIIVLVVRRIPIMLTIKPITPDIHTWREALFCGHFGPIGVGAIFMSLLARAQFETNSETPTAELPLGDPQYRLIATIWPVTCFLVIASIAIHGSSIAVFTLGKRINNMAVTLTYTTGGNEPSWMSRLPRTFTENGTNMLQLRRMETEEPLGKKIKKRPKFKRGKGSASVHDEDQVVPEQPPQAHQQQQDVSVNQDTASVHTSASKNGKKIKRRSSSFLHSIGSGIQIHDNDSDKEEEKNASKSGKSIGLKLSVLLDNRGSFEKTDTVDYKKLSGLDVKEINTYVEGTFVVIEDKDGNFIHKFDLGESTTHIEGQPHLEVVVPESSDEDDKPTAEPTDRSDQHQYSTSASPSTDSHDDIKSQSWDTDQSMGKEKFDDYSGDSSTTGATSNINNTSRTSIQRPRRRSRPQKLRRVSTVGLPHSHEQAYVYVIDDIVYVENADGDILRRYKYVRRGDSPEGSSSKPKKSWRSFFPKFIFGKESGHDKEKFQDVEHAPGDMLVPDNQIPLTIAASKAISVKDEQLVRRRLSQMLQAGEVDRRPSRETRESGGGGRGNLNLGSRIGTVRSQAVASDDDDDDEYVTDYDNDEDAEPETDVERHRRLAALGVISTEDPEDDRDEFADQHHANNNQDDEPKITFQLPTRPN